MAYNIAFRLLLKDQFVCAALIITLNDKGFTCVRIQESRKPYHSCSIQLERQTIVLFALLKLQIIIELASFSPVGTYDSLFERMRVSKIYMIYFNYLDPEMSDENVFHQSRYTCMPTLEKIKSTLYGSATL